MIRCASAENLLWVRSFETIEELRLALLKFKQTYNEQWMLAKYVLKYYNCTKYKRLRRLVDELLPASWRSP